MIIEDILSDFNSQFEKILNQQQLEEIRVNFLGKKSPLNELFANLKNLSIEEKKITGAKINEARDFITNQINIKKNYFNDVELDSKLASEKIDISAPIRPIENGSIHPINKVMFDIERIFTAMGFTFENGPEIEDDFHNFTALNMPMNHPARQMQDTFYMQNSPLLLRTHTSNTQIRKMTSAKPPLKICSLGRVFRRDSDQTHTPMFHQFEGFVVDKEVNMGHLKAILESFLEQFFNTADLNLRFRPSFFPFTEPSAEVDINYSIENSRLKIGKGDKFMEILGCGMIHPQVLINCNIDPQEYRGFAFGIGVERLTMLKYGMNDLRMLFENDIRFLKHYNFNSFEFYK
jgi:phenylalanyl-tRNA synthetase alpha chain